MAPDNCFIEFTKEDIEQSVSDRFEQQVVLYPDHRAIKTGVNQLTYSDFNRLANRLARAIRQQSHNNAALALLLEHEAAAIVSIFGVLKAGRSFVPLDPSLPLSRLKYMLDDSGAKVMVANNQTLALARALVDGFRKVINLDRLDSSLGSDNLEIAISPDKMSCILYTSGTTGRPKGVIHTHRNELHNVMHHTNSLHLTADDRLTLLGSYSTGQGLQDLYCTLLNGATLCPWSLKSDGLTGIADWLIGGRITVYHSAATVFRHFVRDLRGDEEFPHLRIIRLGSEQVSWKDVDAYKRHFSKHCLFVNALSSSETKTIRQYVLSKDSQIAGMVPVGYPVEDMDVLILDESGNGLGFNQLGEISVRSRYLSPGYWQRPDLTAATYRADPSSPANRIFRTGEWGRLSPDGCLEHLGRKDAQVKIRGYRVETYETELALLRHPAVDQVLVICRESIRGDKYLAAYIVLNRFPAPTVSELRIFLRERIPQYMIPAAFVFLEFLPLTPNGKVDRNALPEPSIARPALDVSFVAPKGSIEEILAKMWVEILGIEKVGARDNFFDLGGNSLSAMQVVARMERTFNVRVPLKTFFASPTIASSSRNLPANFEPRENLDVLRIVRATRDGILPLSFAQQRLWFLDQWEPESAFYNICRAHRLTGQLDVTAMEESLNSVVQRHEILRTTFPALDGQPKQLIAPVLRLTLGIIDLQKSPEAERDEQSLRLANEEARRPFDLARGPLLRAALVKLAQEEHLFLLTVHQIVCDGWSLQIFFGEFWTYYEAYSAKHLPSVPSLPIQYADFSVWQRQWFQGELLESQLSYWKKQLGTSLPVLNLPTDRSRPVLQSFRGARIPLVFSEFLTEGLNELSRREGVTLFMTLMAAFQTILYRYTWQEDLVVGFPIANRNWAETTGLIGFFVNTLVLRTDLSGNPTFNELLSRVRDVCLSAYANQDLPFEKLVEELRPERERSRNPLFQVMFVSQIPESSGVDLQGLRSQAIDVDARTSKFDLTLSLTERENKLIGFLEYSTDLFDRFTIEGIGGHFRRLLEGIVANPERPISTLPLLTDAEHHQLLVEWNDTKADYPKNSCIHELFEAQVERTPEAIAVEFEEKKLSYRELNARANQLAHYFRHLGVGPETLVAICVERSLEMLVGLLGILKARGAYVPLDPTFPRERLAFMLEDARASALLTEERLVEDRKLKIDDSGDLPFSILDRQIEIICLDRDREKITQQSERNPDKGATAQNLAYVIYTSGSTGKPKSVQVSHRSVLNCLHSVRQRVELTENDVFLALTTISFDIAALELCLPLITGAKLVLASRDEALDGRQLLDRLSECGATAMQATPSAWRFLADAGWCGGEEFKILCGGEALFRQLADQLLQGGASLWNLYGPTETTIWATIAKVEPGASPVLIGRPIANTEIYILDSHLQPAPVGVYAELYIGGDGLARGYLNRPELTAERFVRNPFNDQPDSLLYRTGDLARYRPGGNIEFLGRVDNQVKLRGHRIELGEIESVLNQHPAVKETVIVLRERDSSGDKDLVAYFVPSQDSSPSVTDLRGFLRQKVPEYMVPAIFISIDALPLSSNGKVDRSKLPTPEDSRPNLEEAFVEPRTPVEQLLAGIWAEVLRLERLSVHDNFFHLGGHSLIAARVISRIRKAFQIDLPLRRIFETPTVAGLALTVEEELKSRQKIQSLAILPRLDEEPLPPSIAQEPLLLLERSFPGISLFNIPAAYRLKGPLDLAALEWSINRVVERHEALRTTFPLVNGQPLQFVATTLSMKLEMTDLHELIEDEYEAEIRKLAREAVEQPFDLGNGPLFRVKLLQRGDQDHVFLLTMHHVISDGGSMVVFFRDLAAFYEAYSNGFTPSLPRLPIQYADFAHWQRQALTGELMEAQLAYWKQQLDGPLPPLEFCTGRGRVKELSFLTARKSLSITGELFESLKKLSQREESTLFMILLTALKVLLYCCTGEKDVRVGTLVENRNRRETENLIGHFANTLLIRTNLSADSSFHQLVRQVRDIALAAYTHQDLPFEAVAQALESEKKIDRASLCQVMFIYQTPPLHPINLPGLNISVLDNIKRVEEPELTITTFDLILLLKEGPSGLVGSLIYKADVFDEAIIDRILGDFHAILQRIIFEVDLPVRELCSLRADRAEGPSR